MYEFEIPEDLTACSAEDLEECMTAGREEFGLLNDSDDISDATLERMTELADGLEALNAELQSRVALAVAKRSTFARQIKKARFAGVLKSLGTDPESIRTKLAARVQSLKEGHAAVTDDAE